MSRIEVIVPNICVESEGADAVVEKLIRDAGATDVCSLTFVEELLPPGQGTRFPSMVPKLDRPIMGRDVIHVRTWSSFPPNLDLFRDTFVRPVPVNPRGTTTDWPRRLLEAARRRGLGTSLIEAPLAVPGPDHGSGGRFAYPWPEPGVESCRAVRIDGERIVGVEGKGCPNNPDVRGYALARVRDILEHYPEIDTLYLDHVEFPTYTLEDSFSCFCEHCVAAAARMNIDLGTIRKELMPWFDWLMGRGPCPGRPPLSGTPGDLILFLGGNPAFLNLMRFRAASVERLVEEIRQGMNAWGFERIALGITGFTPTLAMLGSRDYYRLGEVCDVVVPKLYPAHWAVMLGLWTRRIREHHPEIPTERIVEAVARITGWPLSAELVEAQPGSGHPALVDVETVRTEAVKAQKAVGTAARVVAVLHGSGPPEALARQAELVKAVGMDMLVFSYAHMSDEKLKSLA